MRMSRIFLSHTMKYRGAAGGWGETLGPSWKGMPCLGAISFGSEGGVFCVTEAGSGPKSVTT